MGPTQRGIIFVLTVVSIATVGVLGVRAIRAPEQTPWPGRVAVIGLDPDARQPVTFLGIADPVRQAVVSVPVNAVVEIPGSGFLRAYHAYRLDGAAGVRRTLGRLFGVDVPFSATGHGDTYEAVAASFTTAEVPQDAVNDLRDALETQANDWPRLEVGGEQREGLGGVFIVLDPASVAEAASAIGGLGTRVFIDPSELDALVGSSEGEPPAEPAPEPPAERIEPSTVTLDVLNGGSVEMAATETSNRLRDLGYNIGRVGDLEPQDRAVSVVYFREGKEAEGRQVAADLGYESRPLEEGIPIRSSSDLVVVLGDDARA